MLLDFNIHLPLVRKAFDARQLQMQTHPHQPCRYTGPCAVGVCMDEHTRVSVINHPIDCLIEDGVIIVPDGQDQDWTHLQVLHDRGDLTGFSQFLTELETKYAQS